MEILTVVGARPQFIKAAPVSLAIRKAGHREYLVHTGQHYDYGMSQIFFKELQIPQPDLNLAIGSGPHGRQTGEMLIRLEEVIQAKKPDRVLVYGDTNSTLAGALAAVKLQVPLAHVEAGLRSFNREMPEEHNRILTDHCSDILFCPTQTSVDNLAREGITHNVHLVGDTMYDAVLMFSELAQQRSVILQRLDLKPKGFILATIHRPYNTDAESRLRNILSALHKLDEKVIFPVHPRTRKKMEEFGLLKGQSQLIEFDGQSKGSPIALIEPVGYLDMLILEQNARVILTDSGGVQKEAYFFQVPCLTLRSETEWIETVESGWNVLVGTEVDHILATVQERQWPDEALPIFGSGRSASHITQIMSATHRIAGQNT